jgi:hypothetical protein
MEYHPDHNPNDPDANRKFTLVKCAYELLAFDKHCETILEEIKSWPGPPHDGKYRIDNPWKHFVWWRDKFFGSDDDRKKKPDRGKSCI